MIRLTVRVASALACLMWTAAVVGVLRMQSPSRRCLVCDEGEED